VNPETRITRPKNKEKGVLTCLGEVVMEGGVRVKENSTPEAPPSELKPTEIGKVRGFDR